MPETQSLLWEVGCEELPAWACDAIERQLPTLVSEALAGARLAPVTDAMPMVWVGPRRFAMFVPGVPTATEHQQRRVDGPPVKIAFEGGDTQSALTKAGEGFARKLGAAPTDLNVDADKGVVYVEQTLASEPIAAVWPQLATQILDKLQFAKPMRWGSSAYRFVRPIRWMVTLHGQDELSYECWGVTSSRTTRTHRFLGEHRTATLANADSYLDELRALSVVADQSERRDAIDAELERAASALDGKWNDPGGVLREVVHLVEQPSVITGRFDDRYLELPERVLVTAMQSHQRYVPVARDGKLAPAFLAVMNADPAAVDSILPGYERVLAGRLDDAVFSFQRDRSRGLDDMATDASLGAVVFHAKAGSLAARRDRIGVVAAELARQLNVDASLVADAARLSKADQVSTVVQEFAELEGFAGSLYARSAGYDDVVCSAIDSQFLPRGADDALPAAGVPSILALADKFELLVTMFAIGEQPTGSRDPHGLRRAAIGIMRIVLEHDLAVDVTAALAAAGSAISAQGHGACSDELLASIESFVLDRVEKRLVDAGIRVDAVRAARAARLPQLQQLDELARALDAEIRTPSEAFTLVLESQDRSRKLIAKAGEPADGNVDPARFEVESERELHRVLGETQSPLHTAVRERRFTDAVALAAGIGPAVGAFFDRETGVMVLAEDDAIRANRLRLLEDVLRVTRPLGDLSQLQM